MLNAPTAFLKSLCADSFEHLSAMQHTSLTNTHHLQHTSLANHFNYRVKIQSCLLFSFRLFSCSSAWPLLVLLVSLRLKHPMRGFDTERHSRGTGGADVCDTHICRRSSGTSSLILMKVVFVVGLFGLTGRNRSSSTISLNVESHAAYSMT